MFNAKLKSNLCFHLLQCDMFEIGTVDFSIFSDILQAGWLKVPHQGYEKLLLCKTSKEIVEKGREWT